MGRHPRATGYNVEDLRLAIGIVLLGSRAKAAEFAGISERSVYTHLEQNSVWLEETMKILEEAERLRRVNSAEVDEEKFQERLYKMFGKTAALIEEAVEKGDVKTAVTMFREALHYKLGKPANTLIVDGKVQHEHRAVPPAVEQALMQLAQNMGRLELPPAVDDIQEAELVD